MNGLTLDTGALIAFERNERRVIALLEGVLRRKAIIAVPAGVVGQAWRDPRRQVRLVRLLETEGVEIEPLDSQRAKRAGQLCGGTKTTDVIDASVVLCARMRQQPVLTSDADDLRRLDPKLELIEI
ncbi:MAG TPA: PIN domain-containing protein [Kofleriaceae bacterium]